MNLSDRAWWSGRPEATPVKRFTGTRSSSLHVSTRDGTRVAIDLYLPADAPPAEKLPTILSVTPYFRALEFRSPLFSRVVKKLAVVGAAEFAEQITPYGFAHVVMELRGAGASFGSRRSRMMPDAVSDGSDVIDWIVAQPWSNGRVGATGISAVGMTAEWLLTARHPALRAIAPRFTTFDVFAATHPGGLVASRFMVDVGALLRAMDANRPYDMPESAFGRLLMRLMVKGIRRVDGDDDGRLITAAVAEHENNVHPEKDLLGIQYRDDPLPQSGGTATVDSDSPHTHASAMRDSGAAIYAFAAWHDGAFIRDMIALHNTVPNPGSRIVIGPWPHGGRWYSSPLVTERRPTDFDHVAEMVRFFDLHLRDRDLEVATEEPVHYFTMGEERWQSAPAWPPPGAQLMSLHFGPGQVLQTSPAASKGADRYAVDLDAGTGVHSRFGKHLAGGRFPVRYPGRARRDRRLLTYTSAPLSEDTEVTGHPTVELHVLTSEIDGAIFVYLEDVAPEGVVRTVTDGELRLQARAIREGSWPYWAVDPYRPCLRSDAREVVPGERMELSFDLFPISWLFRAGHAIRVAIAGADRDNFLPVPTGDAPLMAVLHGPNSPSRIQLPVMARLAE
jgi:putative CocE/NonD family hydrolase